jgi:glucan phosphoethanolaminetransferase (alkaline phosphatase superfamily)
MATLHQLSGPDREELRLLYQVTVSDIAFFKQQQWSISNYALTVEAALLFIAYQMLAFPLTVCQAWLLVVLSWAVAAAALMAIERLQSSIVGRRQRLANVRAQFGRAFQDAWRIPEEPDFIRWLLVFVLLLSSSLATWLILVRPK